MNWILLLTISGAAFTESAAPTSIGPPAPRDPAPIGVSAAEDGDPDDGDDPTIERRVEEDSASLRQVHDAEVEAHVLDERAPADPAATAVRRLGLESPARSRLCAALQRADHADGRIAGLPEIDYGLHRLKAEYDIPIDVNEEVVRYVRFFQSPRIRPHFVRWLGRARRYVPWFRRILREEGVPADTAYLAMVESGFANRATSHAGAAGAWQFIPATGKRFGLRQDFWVDERRDPEKAARAAARFLKELHAQTGDWRLAWAGYNAGPGRIARARRLGYASFWHMARQGRVLPRETRAYVPKIMAAAIIGKHADAFGFTEGEIEAERSIEHEEVIIPRATELSFVAEAAQVPVSVLLDLNPELRRTRTPRRPYRLKVPRGKSSVFAANWPRVSARATREGATLHRVKRGETLAAISRAYDVPVAVLAGLNRLSSRARLTAGKVLVVPLSPAARRAAEAITRRHVGAARRVRVRAGDTLWSIARRHGVAVKELARWNGIAHPGRHRLHAGRLLTVRPASPERATKVRPGRRARHRVSAAALSQRVRVRSGDSLWSLARRFGVTVGDLARWNRIRRPHTHKLHAGRLLVVRRAGRYHALE
jgi:membrane-bound lytic murein transglycosylase D